MPRAAKRASRRKMRRPRRARGVVLLGELAADGFGRASHSHIQELSDELLKNPRYQEWMTRWAEGYLSALLVKLRARKGRRTPVAGFRRRAAAAGAPTEA